MYIHLTQLALTLVFSAMKKILFKKVQVFQLILPSCQVLCTSEASSLLTVPFIQSLILSLVLLLHTQ